MNTQNFCGSQEFCFRGVLYSFIFYLVKPSCLTGTLCSQSRKGVLLGPSPCSMTWNLSKHQIRTTIGLPPLFTISLWSLSFIILFYVLKVTFHIFCMDFFISVMKICTISLPYPGCLHQFSSSTQDPGCSGVKSLAFRLGSGCSRAFFSLCSGRAFRLRSVPAYAN